MAAKVVLLLVVCALVSSSDIYFSDTTNLCGSRPGCDFNNPIIWLNGTVPNVNDTVYIINTNTTSYPWINVNASESIYIASISTRNVVLNISGQFWINSNASFITTAILITNGSLNTNSYNVGGTTTSFEEESTLHVLQEGSFTDASPSFYVDNSSYIIVPANGSLELNGYAVGFYGSLNVSADSSFSTIAQIFMFGGDDVTVIPNEFMAAALFVNRTITFQGGLIASSLKIYPSASVTVSQSTSVILVNASTTSNLTLINSYGSVNISQNVYGVISIYASELSLGSSSPNNVTSWNGTLNYSGVNIITLSNIVIEGPIIALSQSSYLNITTINTVAFTLANPNLNGSLSVQSGTTTINDSISFSGACSVSSSFLATYNHFSCAVLAVGSYAYYTSYGSVQAESFYLEGIYRPVCRNVTTLNANMYNNGIVDTTDCSLLLVQQSYKQTGTLELLGLRASDSSPRLWIEGSAALGGKLSFSFNDTPVSGAKYFLVETSNNTLEGKFENFVQQDTTFGNTFEINYITPNQVYLVIGSAPPAPSHHLKWYYWLLIVLAIVAVVGFIALFIIRKRKQESGYERILGAERR